MFSDKLNDIYLYAARFTDIGVNVPFLQIHSAENNFLNQSLNSAIIAQYITIYQSSNYMRVLALCELELYKGGK